MGSSNLDEIHSVLNEKFESDLAKVTSSLEHRLSLRDEQLEAARQQILQLNETIEQQRAKVLSLANDSEKRRIEL